MGKGLQGGLLGRIEKLYKSSIDCSVHIIISRTGTKFSNNLPGVQLQALYSYHAIESIFLQTSKNSLFHHNISLGVSCESTKLDPNGMYMSAHAHVINLHEAQEKVGYKRMEYSLASLHPHVEEWSHNSLAQSAIIELL